jgi:hypothetical protein
VPFLTDWGGFVTSKAVPCQSPLKPLCTEDHIHDVSSSELQSKTRLERKDENVSALLPSLLITPTCSQKSRTPVPRQTFFKHEAQTRNRMPAWDNNDYLR